MIQHFLDLNPWEIYNKFWSKPMTYLSLPTISLLLCITIQVAMTWFDEIKVGAR